MMFRFQMRLNPSQLEYDDSDIIYWTPQILVENQYTLSASSRTITMEVCGGDHTQSATCPANQILKEATAQSPNDPNGNEGDSAFVRSILSYGSLIP